MGISTHFYTYFGIKHPWNDELAEAYNEVWPDNNVHILFDGMCGGYMILGKRLYDSGDCRWGFEDGDMYKEYTTHELFVYETEYRLKFNAEYPDYAYLVNQPFKIISLAHYS